MRGFGFRWGVAQVAIYAGIVCIAVGFASNLVGVVYAQSCPNQVPLNSLCVTTPFPICPVGTTNQTVCAAQSEWDVKSGWFQCVMLPLSGTICFDSFNSDPCYTVYGCHVKYGFCTKNTEGANQPYSKVTKSWDWCPS